MADTDFSLRFKKRKDVKKFRGRHHNPLIQGNFGDSKEFILELSRLIKRIGFNNFIEYPTRYLKCTGKTYQNYRVNIVGKRNLIRWMKEIGFANKRQKMKYLTWKKHGFCEPFVVANNIIGENYLNRRAAI